MVVAEWLVHLVLNQMVGVRDQQMPDSEWQVPARCLHPKITQLVRKWVSTLLGLLNLVTIWQCLISHLVGRSLIWVLNDSFTVTLLIHYVLLCVSKALISGPHLPNKSNFIDIKWNANLKKFQQLIALNINLKRTSSIHLVSAVKWFYIIIGLQLSMQIRHVIVTSKGLRREMAKTKSLVVM